MPVGEETKLRFSQPEIVMSTDGEAAEPSAMALTATIMWMNKGILPVGLLRRKDPPSSMVAVMLVYVAPEGRTP